MKLVNKHFPRHHKYYKLINRNNIKLSYSCMPNMNSVIRKHNSKIMKNPASSTTKTCNCHQKSDCLMDGNWLSECLPYKASVSTTTNKYYYGTCENNFKERTINVLLEINLVERTLNCPSTYGNWKRKMLTILLIGILLRKHRNMFVDLGSAIYEFVRSSVLLGQNLMFCSINVMSWSQHVA